VQPAPVPLPSKVLKKRLRAAPAAPVANLQNGTRLRSCGCLQKHYASSGLVKSPTRLQHCCCLRQKRTRILSCGKRDTSLALLLQAVRADPHPPLAPPPT